MVFTDSLKDVKDEVEHYWDQRKTVKSVPAHFEDDDYIHHNKTTFEYPIFRDQTLLQKFIDKQQGNFELPQQIIPTFNEENKCKHLNIFIRSDEALIPVSQQSVIYSQTSETLSAMKVYARRSAARAYSSQIPMNYYSGA